MLFFMTRYLFTVYIDDVVEKPDFRNGHAVNLRNALRKHKLKMNPQKCAFEVFAGNFLGFSVHQKGIEIDKKNKARAIVEAKSPKEKKKVRRLIEKISFLKRFTRGKFNLFLHYWR